MDTQLRNFLHLIQRSPDRGEGWRTVSTTCWPLIESIPAELVELAPNNMGGGKMRLTEKGETLLFYM